MPAGPEHRWSSGLGVRRPPLSPPAKAGLCCSPLYSRAGLPCPVRAIWRHSSIGRVPGSDPGGCWFEPSCRCQCSSAIMVVGPPGTRVSCRGLEVQVLSAAPYAVVAHKGKSAVKRIPVAGTGSRSTERQAKPKSGKIRLLKCVGKRVILDAMLRQREWVRVPSTAPFASYQQVSNPLARKGLEVLGMKVR